MLNSAKETYVLGFDERNILEICTTYRYDEDYTRYPEMSRVYFGCSLRDATFLRV